jgi:nicotinate-nucleotide--dimethylbenzimidazole phosphoribosyltransferase
MDLKSILHKIKPAADASLAREIQAKLDDLTKPQGSLGRLEEFVMQYCLCRADATANISNMSLFTFAGDHGITGEGIAPFPKDVTYQMVLNMCNGGAAVSVMCKNAGINYNVVDVGVDADFEAHPILIQSKVARGTASFKNNNAMTSDQCSEAIKRGIELASKSNYDLAGIGEMGIGNSSSASALYSLLLDIDPDLTVGAGAGATGILLEKKKKVIRESVQFHRATWDKTPFDALMRLGGLEIAAMVGFCLGSAMKRIPVVVDGFIASSAALVALKMTPDIKDYLFFSHSSAESFHKGFLSMFGIRAILCLDMRLGEGTGSVLAMQIISQAMNCYHQMATFSSAGVSRE